MTESTHKRRNEAMNLTRHSLFIECTRIVSELLNQWSAPLSGQIDNLLEEMPMTSIWSIEGFVRNWRRKAKEAVCPEEFAEYLAFTFRAPYQRSPQQHSSWNTYFGETFSNPDPNTGKLSPDISEINADVIRCWKRRAFEVDHPLLSARYSDLVWDFEDKVPGHRKSVKFARKAVDSYITYSREYSEKHSYYQWADLSRALQISQMTKDSEGEKNVVGAMLEYEKRLGEDDSPGTWGDVFSLLLLDRRAKIQDSVKSEVLLDQIQRFTRICAKPETNTHSIRYGYELLRDYFLLEKGKTPLWIREEFSRWMIEHALKDSEPMRSQVNLISTFFTLVEKEKNDEISERVLLMCEESGLRVVSSLKANTFMTEIPVQKIADCVERQLAKDKDAFLSWIAFSFVISEKLLRESVLKASEDCIWYRFAPPVEIDRYGRPLNSVVVNDNGDGMLFHEGKRAVYLHFHSCLFAIREYLARTLNPVEDIAEHCYKSPIFDESHKLLFKRGIRAFVEKDYITCVSTLVPEIEHTIRHLARKMEIPSWEPYRGHTFHVKTLGTLVDDKRIAQALGNLLFEMKIVFSDPRGFNIRNDFCHGLLSEEDYNELSCVMLIHIVLYLGLLRDRKR